MPVITCHPQLALLAVAGHGGRTQFARTACSALGRMLLLALAAAACKSETVTGVEPSTSTMLPLRPGQSVAAAGLSYNTRLLWDGGGEITYTAIDFAGASQVRAVSVTDGRLRTIDSTSSRSVTHGGLWVSRDGRHTFFSRSGELYHVAPDAPAVRVAMNFVMFSSRDGSPFGADVLPGADASQVVYATRPDSLWVYDARVKTSRFLTAGCTRLITRSPDGQQVLCRTGTTSFGIIDVNTGAMTPSGSFAGPSYSIYSLHWSNRGIEHIRSGAHYFMELVNWTSGAAVTVIPADTIVDFNATLDSPDLMSLTWSKDGRKVAYSRNLCDLRGFDCARTQYQLHVFDVETRTTTIAAVVNREIRSIVFSPDGTRLAYVAAHQTSFAELYTVSVP